MTDFTPILTTNKNQQRAHTAAQAQENIEKSARFGIPFNPEIHARNIGKPVVFVGGGSADEYQNVVDAHGGDRNVHVVAIGSAANRLNKEAQIEAGYPYIERADAVVMNHVDVEDDGSYNLRIANACKMHPEVQVYLASYNHFEAYQDLPPEHLIRVNALMDGYEYEETDRVVGLGSTAATAALVVAMVEGHRHFEFVGVTGANLQAAENGDTYESLLSEFSKASRKIKESSRYPDFEMPEHLQSIKEKNKFVVCTKDGRLAAIPSGQWFQLEELKRLVDWGRKQGMTFTFHGDNSLSSAVLMKGEDLILLHDPDGQIKRGATITGSKPEGLENQGFHNEIK